MKELKINEYAILTTEHPASHYGIPVLVTEDGRGYGPSQKTHPDKFDVVFNNYRAAHSVYSFAIGLDPVADAEALEFCKLYLGQWPEGPQI